MPFIVLEGLDGAGKSTQVGLLRAMLEGRGVATEYIHFPRFDAPVYGELIARFLRGDLGTIDEVNPYLVALIFACDRADAAPSMRRSLDEDKWLIVDRYVYSNIGYQCAKLPPAERNALKNWILQLEFDHNRLPRPDLSLFLDVPFEFVADRLTAARQGDDRDYLKGSTDIHEASLDLQRTVRQVYTQAAALDPRMKVVDCSTPCGRIATPEVIFSRILSYINKELPGGA
ncbi:MAG: dTMP kinase [Rikenellaceae bacterium]|jgi:dTMP kinase|nr:dTMP kinase [Rikenellaceae bacterium]